jgi:transcriptional regulator with XRE-family HTH domain
MYLPTGNELKAARALAGLRTGEVATLAKVDNSTLSRLEGFGPHTVRGHSVTIAKIIKVLTQHGVEITPNCVRLLKTRR